METNKPWLDENGKLLSELKIKEISKNWNLETWDQFLAETVDVTPNEIEILRYDYQDLCEETANGIWSGPCSVPTEVKREIHDAIRDLRKKNKAIIKLVYWKNYSLREVARNQKISLTRVQQIKFESLNQIKELLQKDLYTPSYLIEGSKKFGLPENKTQLIRQVYKKDLEGSYLDWSHGRKKLNCEL